MFIIRNLLKITIICLGVTYLIAPTAKAQFTFAEESAMAEETKGMSQAELQAYYTKKQQEKEDAAERGSNLTKWYGAKVKQLNINYNTQEDKDKIAAGKKEWDAKKATMTLEEFKKAFNAWRFAPKPFTKLNPETATDADVIAAAREANVKSEVDDYIEDLIDDWDKDEDREKSANRKPESSAQSNSTAAGATESMDLKDIPAAQISAPEASLELPTTMTQTVITNNNGTITQETSSGSVKQNTPDGAGIAAPDGSNTGLAQVTDSASGKKVAAEAEKEKAEDKKTEQYTGVYNDRQLIPNEMAIHCKINAEDVVNDMSKLEGCIRQYISEMNNDNATEAQVGREDYNTLRYSVLNDLLATAITKAASVNGYEETMNKYAEATSESETKFDTEAALSNTQAFSTDVMNSIRELYVKVLTNEAIEGFNTIDAKAIADLNEEVTPKAKSSQTTAKKGSTVTTQTETKVTVGADEPQGEDKSAADVVTTPAEEAAAEPATAPEAQAAQTQPAATSQSTGDPKYANMSDEDIENAINAALEKESELEGSGNEEDKEKRRAYKAERQAMEAELQRRENEKMNHPEKLTDRELTEAEAEMRGRIEEVARDIAAGRTVDKAQQRAYHEALERIQAEQAKRRGR